MATTQLEVHPISGTLGAELRGVGLAGEFGDSTVAAIREALLEHGHREEFTCRFRWTPGAVAFWDNRCTKHLALNDSGQFRRHMRRIQIAGDKPY